MQDGLPLWTIRIRCAGTPEAGEGLPSGPPAAGVGHGVRLGKIGALPHSVGLTTILFFENGFGDHGMDPFITIW